MNSSKQNLLISCLLIIISSISCFSAKPPERGTIRIPEMKINSAAMNSLLDSVIDFAKDKYVHLKNHNIYLTFSQIQCGDEILDDYGLTIWIESTQNIPWSNNWYAYCNVKGITCFMNEMFANYFAGKKKYGYRTFEYNYTKERNIAKPGYEWSYLVTPIKNGKMRFKLEYIKRISVSLAQMWMKYYDRLRTIEKLEKEGDDWPLK